MDTDPVTAMSVTPTKGAAHLSMTARHDPTKEIFDSCHVSVSSTTALGNSVITGKSATALSLTLTKEATHLSMTTRHDLAKEVFVSCHAVA